MAMPRPMPDEAPVTNALWPNSFRSMGQAGITTGGSVSSLASQADFTSTVHAPLLYPAAYSSGRAVRLHSPRPKGRSIRFTREMPDGSRFDNLRLSTGRAGSHGR